MGDSLTLNILGREITAEIANTRRVDWSNLDINFVLIFAPGTLEGAPQTHIATAYVSDAGEDGLERAVGEAFANVSIIRVREALDTIKDILTKIGLAVRLTAIVTLVAGGLVLAGAFAANQQRRIYDSVIFKVLGATRRDVARAFGLEYAILGLATGVVSIGIGSLAAWAVLTQLMRASYEATPATAVLTVLGGIAITLLFGFASTWRALGQKAQPVLRTE